MPLSSEEQTTALATLRATAIQCLEAAKAAIDARPIVIALREVGRAQHGAFWFPGAIPCNPNELSSLKMWSDRLVADTVITSGNATTALSGVFPTGPLPGPRYDQRVSDTA